jgi:hypothetical protein
MDVYIDRYPEYQDYLEPFFLLILSKVIEYKEVHWDPEFLQLLGQVELLHEDMHKGFQRIEEGQTSIAETVKETNALIKSSLETLGYEDLNQLLANGQIIKARELANDRLKKKHIQREEMRELNAIIATSYMLNGEEEEAISYLHIVMTLCEDHPRRKRTEALINLFQKDLDKAYSFAQEAIKIEGNTKNNIEILVNILIQKEEYSKAVQLINAHTEFNFCFLLSQAYLFQKKYDEVIKLAEENIEKGNDLKDWLLLKAEALVLQLEDEITENYIYANIHDTFREVMPILDNIVEGNENGRQLLRVEELRAGLYFRSKRFSEAGVHYLKVYEKKGDKGKVYFNNLITSYYLAENWERVLSLISEKIESGTFELPDVIFYARIYIDAGKPDEAINLLKGNEAIVNGEERYLLYVTQIEAMFLSLRHGEIEELINELENINSNMVTLLKGHYSLLKHNWDEAIYFLELGMEQREALVETKLELIRAYENRGTKEDFKKIVNIIPAVSHWKMHESLFNRYVNALFQLGEYKEILSYYNSDQIPYKSNFLIEIATTVYFNLQWYDIAKENYIHLYQKTKDIRYLFRHANCLFRLGQTKKCLDALSAAEFQVQKSGTIEDFNLMSIAYMEALQFEKSLEYAYKTYLAGKNNSRVLRFFFWQFLQLSQYVENPREVWVKAYQEIFNEFHTRFPDEDPLYEQHKAIEDGKISGSVIKVLKDAASHFDYFRTLYITYKMPGMLYAEILNKGLFETWGHIMNDHSMDTWVFNGELREIRNGIKNVSRSKDVLCDIFTLLSFDKVGMLEKLKRKYNLFIYQEQFDKIFEECSRTKLIQESGIKTISYENERLVMQETTSDYVKEVLQKQEKVIQWLNDNCQKLGQAIINEDSVDQASDRDNLSIIDNLLKVAKENACTVVIDSTIIRDHAEQQYGVNCFNLVDFINELHLQKQISSAAYYDNIGNLISMGYLLIPLNSHIYIHYLEKNHYKLNDEMFMLFQYLRRKEWSEEYVLNLVSDIFRWIWLESVNYIDRHNITDYLCFIVTNQKSKRDMVKRLLESADRKFNPLVRYQYEKLETCVKQWLYAQSII